MKVLFFFAAFVVALVTLGEDVVTLKNGKVLRGEVIEYDDGKLRVQDTNGSITTGNISGVQRIVFDVKKNQVKKLPSALLPEVRAFFQKHPEFGSPTGTQAFPDWVKGKRQGVVLSNRRILLFYLQDEKVLTVYEQDRNGGKSKIWGAYAEGAEYMKDVSRQATSNIPEYKVISAINLNIGGKGADVLIPSLTRNTPREERSRIAHAILKKEGLREMSMFSTLEAKKAAYSSSFAKGHPEAKKGFLGAIEMDSGKFYD